MALTVGNTIPISWTTLDAKSIEEAILKIQQEQVAAQTGLPSGTTASGVLSAADIATIQSAAKGTSGIARDVLAAASNPAYGLAAPAQLAMESVAVTGLGTSIQKSASNLGYDITEAMVLCAKAAQTSKATDQLDAQNRGALAFSARMAVADNQEAAGDKELQGGLVAGTLQIAGSAISLVSAGAALKDIKSGMAEIAPAPAAPTPPPVLNISASKVGVEMADVKIIGTVQTPDAANPTLVAVESEAPTAPAIKGSEMQAKLYSSRGDGALSVGSSISGGLSGAGSVIKAVDDNEASAKRAESTRLQALADKISSGAELQRSRAAAADQLAKQALDSVTSITQSIEQTNNKTANNMA